MHPKFSWSTIQFEAGQNGRHYSNIILRDSLLTQPGSDLGPHTAADSAIQTSTLHACASFELVQDPDRTRDPFHSSDKYRMRRRCRIPAVHIASRRLIRAAAAGEG
jgi:hypothetical protein